MHAVPSYARANLHCSFALFFPYNTCSSLSFNECKMKIYSHVHHKIYAGNHEMSQLTTNDSTLDVYTTTQYNLR